MSSAKRERLSDLPKKAKVEFLERYKIDYEFIDKSNKDKPRAFYKPCRCDINIAHERRRRKTSSSIVHASSAKHQRNVKWADLVMKTPKIANRIFNTFYTNASKAETPNMNHTKRRRSLRQARKHLQESQNNSSNNSRSGRKRAPGKGHHDMFSQTTVSSGDSNCNVSLATMGSYREFAAKLKTSSSSSHPGNSTTLSIDSDRSKKSTGRKA